VVELKLGKLPDRVAVKITFMASAELNRDLQAYADAYVAAYGVSESVPELIPFMLATLMASDSGFRKSRADREPAALKPPVVKAKIQA
jgi:hypothetical protein